MNQSSTKPYQANVKNDSQHDILLVNTVDYVHDSYRLKSALEL